MILDHRVFLPRGTIDVRMVSTSNAGSALSTATSQSDQSDSMSAADELPSVCLLEDRIMIHYESAVDGTPCAETISTTDVVQVLLERSEMVNGTATIHWFLLHRDGWTCHFNDAFCGAGEVVPRLQILLGFAVPPLDEIAGPGSEGTVVWSPR